MLDQKCKWKLGKIIPVKFEILAFYRTKGVGGDIEV